MRIRKMIYVYSVANQVIKSHNSLDTNTPQHVKHVEIIKKYNTPWSGRKEGNVLFNDALNTFYLRLYGVGHMVKDHSDSERGNPLPSHGLLFQINSKGSFICTMPQTGYHIPRPLLHQSWRTGWNETHEENYLQNRVSGPVLVNNLIYHIIYKSSNRNKVRDKFGITYFEKLITMQIRSRD